MLRDDGMAPSRTRVVNTLIGLLTVAVVGLTVLPWLVPRIQEAVRDKPDSDRVLTAVKEHQAVIDAERTDAEASTGASPPMRAEETIRGERDQLAQMGIRWRDVKSEVRLVKAAFHDNGTVRATTKVTTSMIYGDSSDVVTTEVVPHVLTLTGSDGAGYKVVQDVIIEPELTGSPPDRAHVARAVTAAFVAIALAAMALSWWKRGRTPHMSLIPRVFPWFRFGCAFALAIGLAWMFTVDNAEVEDEFGAGSVLCMRERFSTLEFGYFSHDCVVQSRIDVLAALLTAIAIVLIEYRILLSLEARTDRVSLPGASQNDDSGATPGRGGATVRQKAGC